HSPPGTLHKFFLRNQMHHKTHLVGGLEFARLAKALSFRLGLLCPNTTGLARDHIFSEERMPRPTVLVAEPEPPQSLSVRKLVLETAKFNVLTAHSTREALDIFELFPNISAAVLVGESGLDCDLIANS